jgi:hypothetical protein
MKEMNDLYLRMAVDDRRDYDGENNVREDHDHTCGLGVEMNGHLCMRMAVDDHRDHDGANNVRQDRGMKEMNDMYLRMAVDDRHDHDGEKNIHEDHDHTCSRGNDSVLPSLLKVMRVVQAYFLVWSVFLEEMYVFLYAQMTVDVDRSDI